MSKQQATEFAVYVERQVEVLAEQPISDLVSGRVRFVDPQTADSPGAEHVGEAGA